MHNQLSPVLRWVAATLCGILVVMLGAGAAHIVEEVRLSNKRSDTAMERAASAAQRAEVNHQILKRIEKKLEVLHGNQGVIYDDQRELKRKLERFLGTTH